MTIDDKIRYEELTLALTEKQQEYQDYYPEKVVNMNALQVKKYYLLIQEE